MFISNSSLALSLLLFQNGVVGVWKIDEKNKPALLHKYQANGIVQHVIFRPNNTTSTSLSESPIQEILSSSENTVFFFAYGFAGVVSVADDAGHCVEAFTCGAPLASLLFKSSSIDRIVALTENSLMLVYEITKDFQLKSLVKGKISLAMGYKSQVTSKTDSSPQTPELQAVWISPTLLATCSPNVESLIRFWDLDQEENFFISLPSAQDIITCFDYNPRKSCLAVGTNQGTVLFFKNNSTLPVIKDSDWEMILEQPARGSVISIQWGPGEQLLSSHDGENVTLFHETILQRRCKHGFAAVQTVSDSVTIESLETKVS